MSLEEFLAEWHNDSPYVCVHTSGSTGNPKPLLVEKHRMEASAHITCNFLGLKEGDTALLCLPLDYIAGKMMVVRALTCGLQLISVEPSSHPMAAANFSLFTIHSSLSFAAMVPLQVWNSLQVPEERKRLMQIKHLIIGGGAIDEKLERKLKDFPNAVWSTYGMTETLSHIALRRLSGAEASQWYTPFESVVVSLNKENCLVIDAPLVCGERLTTNDIAELAADGRRFRIIGRKDNVICSGGIKIQIEEVERLLHSHLPAPFAISKCNDAKFGEAVVLVTEDEDLAVAHAVCERILPKYWRPRHYLHVSSIPLTATGKLARAEIEHLATEANRLSILP